jgi:DNA-binding response OmpR family regulator
MGPMLRRVLICDPNPQSGRFLNELMRDVSRAQIWTAPTNARAMRQAAVCEPQLIFVEYQTEGVDGLAFTRELRRSQLPCRQAPVIMVTHVATAAAILGARDAGVHEFLRKPFSLKDLLRRLEAVTLRSRDWVEGVGYVGPDRRRFNSGDYSGPLKRGSDSRESPSEAQLQQSLKILRAGINALDRDPDQAMRAMLAQAVIIQKAALAVGDQKLAAGAAELYARLVTSHGGPPPAATVLSPITDPLLAHLKEDGKSLEAA